jgi:DNA polymerase sigma
MVLDMDVRLLTTCAGGMDKVVCRAVAKVPIVKCWDPELELACDINVNNPLALENTRMIRTYVQLDDRVRPLAKIIKYWTKRRLLNDAGRYNNCCELVFGY